MPTGYTADIAKGISFEKFIMNCARAFGALISMRDESHDTEIPKEFKPSDYHKKKVAETEIQLSTIKKMTAKHIEGEAKQAYELELKSIEDGIRKAEELRAKYSSMLAKVRAWQSPSNDHDGLKKFMEEQIINSIEFDCSTKYYTDKKPVLLFGQQWKEQRLAELLKDLAYHKKELIAEIERTKGRNIWITQLRKSLKGGPEC